MVPYCSSRPLQGLGCNRPSFGRLGAVAPSPMVRSMQTMMAKGMAPKLVLLQAYRQLQSQGETHITPDIQQQLLMGLQSSGKLGALGYGGTVSSAAGGATTGASLGSAFPVVGTAIGAVVGAIVGEAAHLMQRHVGKAEASWTAPGFYASLNVTQGRDYDEKQFSEAFKGMLDTGNNIVPGCGPDRHKNPDCLLGPMAAVIAQGYLSGAVPLSATTQQVFSQVVTPWLQSGAGGLVNGRALMGEAIQLQMMKAATDRYLAGEAMTRGDMPAYQNQGAHTPTLVQALSSILTPANTSTGVPASTASVPVPYTAPAIPLSTGSSAPVTVIGMTAGGTPVVPVDQTAQLIAQLKAQGDSNQAAYNAAMASLQTQGVQATPQVQAQVQSDVTGVPVGSATPATASLGGGLSSSWLGIGVAVAALGFALVRPARGKRR
jgi:hypothetical protein